MSLNTLFLINAEFPAGQLVATRGVVDLSQQNPEFGKFVQKCINRHFHKDWGDVDAEDKKANDQALKDGDRVLSAYNDERFPKNGVATIWIITEGDRSATTILFPNDY